MVVGSRDAPSIADGAIVLESDGKTLAAVGPKFELVAQFPDARFESHHGVLIPGLINASVTLEDEGLAAVGGQGYFAHDLALARARAERADEVDVDALKRRCGKLRETGTVAAGVVSTTLLDANAIRESGIIARVFHPVRGMREETAAVMLQLADELVRERGNSLRVQRSLHSLYALHPKAVTVVISDATEADARILVPLCTGAVERASLLDAPNPFDSLLSASPDNARDWPSPACDPISYATQLDALSARTFVSGLIDATAGELGRIAAWTQLAGVTPRQDLFTDARMPDVATMLALGLEVAVGTGSVAVVPDVDVLEEVRAIAARFPQFSAAGLLPLAMEHGARALGVDARLGSLRPGKSPGVLLVESKTPVTSDPAAFVLREKRGARRLLVGASES